MNNLQEIALKVTPEIARYYQTISQSEQDKIQLKLTDILSLELEKRQEKARNKLSILMDKASDEAKSNGLTPEILEEILQNNE